MAVDPSSLSVRVYPDPVLRRRAEPVELSDEVRAVARRMLELMREEEGIGLAAPQVGLPWRLFVTHVPEGDGRSATDSPPTAESAPCVYLNPVISEPDGELKALEEGCLSLPRIRGSVLRPPRVTITATGLDGKVFTRAGAGLLARCWQHEQDHLDGVLIIDKMLAIYKLKNRGAIRDLEADWAESGRSR
ncbi:MAG: peptide deformylase [Leptolyngbya sp. PLA1]|nr:peptide deformylase [Leptolyngbya sp. PLA1]